MNEARENFDSWRSCHSMLPWLHEGRKGRARIVHYEVTDSLSRLSARHGGNVRPGTYVCLEIAGVTVMSDTDFERETSSELLRRAHGRVLLSGLGLGMVLVPLLEHPKVESVTVVEKERDVIDLVEPQLREAFHPPPGRLRIVRGNIFRWHPENGESFNVMYFDIWPMIGPDFIGEMERLHRRLGKFKDSADPHAWVTSWLYESLKSAQGTGSNPPQRPINGANV